MSLDSEARGIDASMSLRVNVCRTPVVASFFAAFALMNAAACSGGGPERRLGDGQTPGGAGAGGTGAGGSGVASGAPSFQLPEEDLNYDGPGLAPGQTLEPGQVCEDVSQTTQPIPVDLLIMLDHSVSMTEPVAAGETTTRWEAVTEALRTFFEHPDAQQIRIAYDYYAHPDDAGAELGSYQCDPANYSSPEVPLAPAAEAGPAVSALLGPQPVGTFTPTYPALEGALQWGAESAANNPDNATIVLLATDGLPYSNGSCNDSVPAIAELAQDAYLAEASVRTFVIGVGVGSSNIRAIAEQGGGEAFLIESADVAAEFLDALLTIVNQPESCDFDVPMPTEEDQAIDPNRAYVTITSSATGETRQLQQLRGGGECTLRPQLGGFFYDDPLNPTRLSLCPQTCKELGRGSISFEYACKPRMIQ